MAQAKSPVVVTKDAGGTSITNLGGSGVIKWEVPPASKRLGAGGSAKLDALVAELKSHPGKVSNDEGWALIASGATRYQFAKSLRGSEFERRTVTVVEGDTKVVKSYIRYVG